MRSCERCGTPFEAKRRDARFCSGRCSKAARRLAEREASHAMPRPFTRQDALEDVAAACELLPADVALLEGRHPEGEDEAVDELIAGLLAHVASLERLRVWLAGSPPPTPVDFCSAGGSRGSDLPVSTRPSPLIGRTSDDEHTR
jgi:hypothetical protein